MSETPNAPQTPDSLQPQDGVETRNESASQHTPAPTEAADGSTGGEPHAAAAFSAGPSGVERMDPEPSTAPHAAAPSGAPLAPSPWAPAWQTGVPAGHPQAPTAASYPYPAYSQPPAFGTSRPNAGTTPPFPFGQPPSQPPFGEAQLPAADTEEKRHTKGARATLIGVAVAALALGAGFGGGLIGSSLSHDSSAPTSSSALAPQATGQTASDTSGSAAALPSVQDVADKVLPSVVSVVALTQQGEGEGSGVVLTDSGLILTNNHVIDGADTLTVQFNDGTTANATVVGADPTDDLAVIRASGVSGLTPAALGTSSTVKVGQQVVAIGSPLGLSATVTTGIVSALNRPVRTESAQSQQSQGTVLSAIQTDAAINPGNSGGPLVNMSGQVIGINSAIAALSSGIGGQSGSIGVGFAIPIDQAYRIAQEIINTGTASHAVLGANVTDAVDRSRGITTGAQIAQVVQGSGAEKAGLQAGDIVTKVGSVPIESADALVATIRSSEPGGTVSLTYLRSGQPHTVSVTLGSSGK